MKTIKELYYGKTNPSQRGLREHSELTKLSREWLEKYDAFRKTLSENDAELLRQLDDLQEQLSELMNAENYMRGFRDGANLMIDVLTGRSDNLK